MCGMHVDGIVQLSEHRDNCVVCCELLSELQCCRLKLSSAF